MGRPQGVVAWGQRTCTCGAHGDGPARSSQAVRLLLLGWQPQGVLCSSICCSTAYSQDVPSRAPLAPALLWVHTWPSVPAAGELTSSSLSLVQNVALCSFDRICPLFLTSYQAELKCKNDFFGLLKHFPPVLVLRTEDSDTVSVSFTSVFPGCTSPRCTAPTGRAGPAVGNPSSGFSWTRDWVSGDEHIWVFAKTM